MQKTTAVLRNIRLLWHSDWPKEQETKRATLSELVDYVSTNRGVLVEPVYPEITTMVSIHVMSTKL